jgi:hypothetical protein
MLVAIVCEVYPVSSRAKVVVGWTFDLPFSVLRRLSHHLSSLLVAAPRGQHYFLCGLAIGWANPVVFAPIRGDGQTVNECKDDWDSHGICATVAYNPDLMD